VEEDVQEDDGDEEDGAIFVYRLSFFFSFSVPALVYSSLRPRTEI
jgi:hypothetical protein